MNATTIKKPPRTEKAPRTEYCQLKGSLFPLTVLQLYNDDALGLEQQLKQKISTAPDFFRDTPIVLDLSQFKQTTKPDFFTLQTLCRKLGLIPVAMRGSDRFKGDAQQAGLAILPAKASRSTLQSSSQATTTVIEPVASTTEPGRHNKTKIINHQVRSGQQIHNTQGDLIVINSVSPGAELIANGSIHVYGSLKGRALAGINGDSSARIFCRKLEAELVSIAGHYQINDDLQHHLYKTPVQIYLEREQLIIRPL